MFIFIYKMDTSADRAEYVAQYVAAPTQRRNLVYQAFLAALGPLGNTLFRVVEQNVIDQNALHLVTALLAGGPALCVLAQFGSVTCSLIYFFCVYFFSYTLTNVFYVWTSFPSDVDALVTSLMDNTEIMKKQLKLLLAGLGAKTKQEARRDPASFVMNLYTKTIDLAMYVVGKTPTLASDLEILVPILDTTLASLQAANSSYPEPSRMALLAGISSFSYAVGVLPEQLNAMLGSSALLPYVPYLQNSTDLVTYSEEILRTKDMSLRPYVEALAEGQDLILSVIETYYLDFFSGSPYQEDVKALFNRTQTIFATSYGGIADALNDFEHARVYAESGLGMVPYLPFNVSKYALRAVPYGAQIVQSYKPLEETVYALESISIMIILLNMVLFLVALYRLRSDIKRFVPTLPPGFASAR